MLGIYRYVLALMVMLSHVWPGFMWWQGIYGVFCFYLISGYLMSMVLNEVYVGKSGRFRYLVNRFLRIYPLYWVCLLLTIFSIYWYQINLDLPFVRLPADLLDYIGNITLLFPFDTNLTIVVGWSLRVELVYYVILMFVARNFKLVSLWLFCSIVYIFYLEWSSTVFIERYETILGASVAFSLGAFLYHIRKYLTLGNKHLYISTLLYFSYLWFSPDIWGFTRGDNPFAFYRRVGDFGLYGNLLLGAYLLLASLSFKVNDLVKSLGDKLGDLAYAVFLIHWIVLLLVDNLLVPSSNVMVFVPICFVLVNILSVALVLAVEKPINRLLRDRIRVGNA